MTGIDLKTTLGALVTQRPELARPLDRIGLDYCCGGERTVAEAAVAAGLDADEVVTLLAEEAPIESPDDWASLGPSELVDHLEATHHRYLREALPRLTELIDRVLSAHGERHPELRDARATFLALRRDLEPHLLKEEQILFPMIRELMASPVPPTFHCGTLANPIRVMGMEHDGAGELLARLRDQTTGYAVPDDGCTRYRALFAGLVELEADTHLHIHKENNVLFPAVVAEEARRAAP
jgi:regulator of cell morphogenesis and NO signaling